VNGMIHHLVAYADTDAGGVVYHGRYVELAERSRLLALHEAGWTVARLQDELGVVLVVHRVHAYFCRPARLEQWLEVSTQFRQAGAVHCVLRTRFERDGEVLATLDAELVALFGRQLTRIPDVLLHDLTEIHPDPVSVPQPTLQNSMKRRVIP
jgi:acyl-CoA thioester hydrolase